jgi:dipeptidyl aminopeptidase/acylaminoacyl peptidase
VNLPRDAAGSLPDIRPKVAVALAGLLDLRAAFEEKLGGNAVSELVGANPDPEGRVWQRVSPIELLPTGASLLIVHGKSDFVVPQEQSEAYYRAAIASGDRAELLIIDRADHFDVIDPDSEAWQETFAALDRLLDETD